MTAHKRAVKLAGGELGEGNGLVENFRRVLEKAEAAVEKSRKQKGKK